MLMLVNLAAGAAVAGLLLVALRSVLAAPVLQRTNFRGRELPTAAGLVLVLATVVVTAGAAMVNALRSARGIDEPHAVVLVAVLGFGFLGFVDDLVGTTDTRGFKGHVRALVRGRLTTGGVKLVLGGLLALVIAATLEVESVGHLLMDAAIVALAANLGNLFDRAPGRVIKVGLVAYAPLAAAAGFTAVGAAIAAVMGAAAALLVGDLRERFMLGDTGANVVGAVLGVGAVLVCSTPASWVVLGVLVALNVASEFVSFSAVIAKVAPLRALDQLGRPRS